MVDRVRSDETIADEVDQAQTEAERLRWINSKMREASVADLIDDAEDVDDEDDPPPSGEQ